MRPLEVDGCQWFECLAIAFGQAMKPFFLFHSSLLLVLFVGNLLGQNSNGLPVQDEYRDFNSTVQSAMRRAAAYYHENVAVHGGYVYHYSLDLKIRWGEGLAKPGQNWVQPPGTPSVGLAYLEAYFVTGDEYYRDCALDAGKALMHGQLSSGGWSNAIDCSGIGRGEKYSGGNKRKPGNSSLDDGQTQTAIEFMVRLDKALEFKNTEVHQSALFALNALLAAQFPNGGFPQVWREPVPDQPVLKASYPDYDWRTEHRVKNYWNMYTTNDNLCDDVADTLIVAHRIYNDDKYLKALERLGDFLILAQMPEPQPAWAQQYNYQMHPIWARIFEPAAITGGESQRIIVALLKIFAVTGKEKYLAPIPKAIDYLKRSELPDGRLARYYELKTNRPLYMVRNGNQYRLTYDDSNLPKHYSFKVGSQVASLERRYQAVKEKPNRVFGVRRVTAEQAKRVIMQLDEQGRWVKTYGKESLIGQGTFAEGEQYISSQDFCQNMQLLVDYLRNAQSK